MPFRVTGVQTTGVSFDRAETTVNGDTYYFAAFPPEVSVENAATISTKVKNTTNQSQTASVSWTIAHWDTSSNENIIEQKTASVTVPAGTSVPVSVTISHAQYPVYLVTGTLTWQGTKSIIGVRFVRPKIDTARINFSGVTSFPLRAGQETTLFSCLHDMGGSTVENARMDVTITDLSGRSIHSYSYTGAVPASIIGVANTFTPTRSYDAFTLTTKLYQGDRIVDEVSIPYNCRDVDPSQCLPGLSLPQKIATTIGVLLGLYILFWVYRRFFHSRSQTPKSL